MRGDPTEPIARELRTRGLTAPALLLLDAHRPLRPLLGVAAAFLLPVIRPVFGGGAQRIHDVLDDDAAYDRLLDRLRSGEGA